MNLRYATLRIVQGWTTLRQTFQAGRLDLSLPTDALVDGYPCCFVEVAKSQYYDFVGFARWYYRGNDFPLYQIVWPSREGLFPWHPNASKEFKVAQPVIAQAPVGA